MTRGPEELETMHPFKTIAVGLLAWPAAEILTFLCVAAAVGLTKAIFLVIVTSLAGLFVLRHFSSRQQVHTADGVFTAAAWSGGAGPGLGGILLLIPGFLTSALGLLVLFPPTRRWLQARFLHLLASRQRQQRTDPGVVDLTPDEWQPLSEKRPLSGQTARK